jgi:hypothetical protein
MKYAEERHLSEMGRREGISWRRCYLGSEFRYK